MRLRSFYRERSRPNRTFGRVLSPTRKCQEVMLKTMTCQSPSPTKFNVPFSPPVIYLDDMKHLKARFEEHKALVSQVEKLMVRGLTELRDEISELAKINN